MIRNVVRDEHRHARGGWCAGQVDHNLANSARNGQDPRKGFVAVLFVRMLNPEKPFKRWVNVCELARGVMFPFLRPDAYGRSFESLHPPLIIFFFPPRIHQRLFGALRVVRREPHRGRVCRRAALMAFQRSPITVVFALRAGARTFCFAQHNLAFCPAAR